jgi:hypothetical protein
MIRLLIGRDIKGSFHELIKVLSWLLSGGTEESYEEFW